MGFQFNPDEVLEMAEQIERNGARFYIEATKAVKDRAVGKLLLELADWERKHERVFAAMRANLTEAERQAMVFDPDHETYLYLRAMADGHIFDVRMNSANLLTGEETAEEILLIAIGKEKDSIIFYLGLKELMSDRTGRHKVDEVIKEEMNHIAYLNKELAAWRQRTI
ncbi:MAG: ferritin family protein [Deltaproteobacteria bacterium]|nr:MAG: ferritin family protein [Deltaproteobacteria bacterium]